MANLDRKTCVEFSVCQCCRGTLRMEVAKNGIVIGTCANAKGDEGVRCGSQFRYDRLQSQEAQAAFIRNGRKPVDNRQIMRATYEQMDRIAAAQVKEPEHEQNEEIPEQSLGNDDPTARPVEPPKPSGDGSIFDDY